MLTIFIWIVFGFFVGLIASALHPGEEPVGCLPTIGIGIGGSFIGGAINWMLGLGNHPFHPSGFLMSIVGGIIFCMIWRWYILRTMPTPRNFFGKRLK
jgi:uncharacterized membrane protein YeaQ/YmgE (transglycosylase-associated protein family)